MFVWLLRRSKALAVCRFPPQVTASDTEVPKEQLKPSSLVCASLKTKFDSSASFNVSVSETDFHLLNNTELFDCPILLVFES